MSSGGWKFNISWGLALVIIIVVTIIAETLSNVYGSKVDLERLQKLEDTNKAIVEQLQQLKQER